MLDTSARVNPCPPTGLVLEALHPRARSEAATRLGDPMVLTLQPNSDRNYKRRRLNDQFQPPLHSGHHDNVDGSHFSFPSNEWTQPSALFPKNVSDQTSGSFNELASRRGLSFHTPTTPTNSSDGGYFYFKGDVGSYRQCSPANAERELQGISSSSRK